MRAVVTGASGFIGSSLTRLLSEKATHVTEVDLPDGDIRDTARLARLLRAARPDHVYHLAAQASVRDSWENPLHTWETNMMGTVSLFEAIRSGCQNAKTVIMSSASVFDGLTVQGRIQETAEPFPRSPYGASKLATELAARNYRAAHGLQVVVARPFNVIGATQQPGYVVPSLARRVLEAKESGQPGIAMGDPAVVRDFIDVRDAVRGLYLLMERGEPGETYHLCTGSGVSIGTIAETFGTLTGHPVACRQDPDTSRGWDAPRLVGDPAKTRTRTGWQPLIPLEDTLSGVLASVRSSAEADR